MDLSISIVNHNGKDLVVPMLDSIFKETKNITFEVFVADNNSTDGSPEIIQSRFPQVHLTRNFQDLYFVKATNQNLLKSQGRYAMISGGDAIILPGALGRMVRYMDTHKEIGILGPQLLDLNGLPQKTCQRSLTVGYVICRLLFLNEMFANNPWLRRHSYADWNQDTIREVDVVCGECLLVRREVLNQIGVLNERLIMYNEEVDLCYRAKNAGWKILYNPEIAIYHHHGATTQKDPPLEIYKMLNESILQFFKDYNSMLIYYFLKMLYRIHLPVVKAKRFFHHSILRPKPSSKL